MMTICADCGARCEQERLTQLDEIGSSLAQRLEPGSEVPAGACEHCGAFAYLDMPSTAVKLAGLVQDDALLNLKALMDAVANHPARGIVDDAI